MVSFKRRKRDGQVFVDTGLTLQRAIPEEARQLADIQRNYFQYISSAETYEELKNLARSVIDSELANPQKDELLALIDRRYGELKEEGRK